MHLDLDAQLEAKRGILLESFGRSGVETSDIPLELTPSPETGYRTRLRFHVSLRSDRLRMGFRSRGSHQVEDVENCRLAGSGLNERWRRIKRFFENESFIARGLVSIELQESSHDPGRVVGHFLVRSSDELRRFDRDVRDTLLHRASLEGLVVAAGSHDVRAGRPSVHHQVALVHNSDRGAELAWPRLPSSDHLAIRHPERRHGVENLAPDPCLNSLCRRPSRSHR